MARHDDTRVGGLEVSSERRVPPRRLCKVPVVVHSLGSRSKCLVTNISVKGCQLNGEAVFALGNEVEVHFTDARIAVPGRIAWKTFDRAGVEFLATVGIGQRR